MPEAPSSSSRDPRESAEWLRRALSAARVGTWEWDIQRETVLWSRETRNIYGLEGEFSGTFEGWAALVHPLDLELTKLAVERALADRSSNEFRVEHRVTQPTGKVIWVEGRGQVLRDETGTALAIIGIAQDVTLRRELELQLAQSQRLETVGRLAGGVAHDFNNLLTAIIGAISLAKSAAPSEIHEDLQTALSAAERATGLTQRLLAFSRQRASDVRLTQLGELVEQAQKMLSRVLRDDIRLRVSLSPEPMPVRVDVAQLEQVLVNLVVNGAEAMPNGGSLEIATGVREIAAGHPRLAAGRYFSLSVRDEGVGMSAEQQQRIFEPFFSTKPRGVGLGLSTSLAIVERIAGTLEVKSELGRGTTVTVQLPQARPERKPTPVVPLAAAPGNSATILIIEDDRAVRETTHRLLARAGFQVLAAEDKAGALGVLAATKHIDLVVTDVIMPEQSGPELVRLLRQARPDLGVLYVSGYAGEALLEHGLREDDAFLQKPYSLEVLVRRIRELLARKEA